VIEKQFPKKRTFNSFVFVFQNKKKLKTKQNKTFRFFKRGRPRSEKKRAQESFRVRDESEWNEMTDLFHFN